jgi:hypothetical protein
MSSNQNQPTPASGTPIEPTVPASVQQDRLEKLLGTRPRDREAVESAHRDLMAVSPTLHRKLLRWLALNEPDSPLLSIGLALLATGSDPSGRQLVAQLVETLPIETVSDLVDYVHGWYVDRVEIQRERRRFSDEMSAAYEASADVVRQELQSQSQARGDDFHGGEILVTLGEYDRVQQVLDHLQLPYQTLPCQVVDDLALRADQVLIVNCPGQFTTVAIENIRKFVAAGGTLITTDWALLTTVQAAFPGTIEYTGSSTADDVVKVSWIHPETIWTRGVEVPGQPINWWLEGSSYPIRILDPRVTILVRSEEMASKYQEDPLVVTFGYGEGRVFHLTSHYYLQRSQGDKGAKAEKTPATGVGQAIMQQAVAGGLSAEQLSAAYSSMRLLANILYESRRQCGV